MSEIDYTAAVETAARAYYDTHYLGGWENAGPVHKYHAREYVLPLVVAASRDIARQAWDEGHRAGWCNALTGPVLTNPYREDDEVDE